MTGLQCLDTGIDGNCQQDSSASLFSLRFPVYPNQPLSSSSLPSLPVEGVDRQGVCAFQVDDCHHDLRFTLGNRTYWTLIVFQISRHWLGDVRDFLNSVLSVDREAPPFVGP